MGIFEEEIKNYKHTPCLYKKSDKKNDGFHTVSLRVGFKYEERDSSQTELHSFYHNFT